MARESVWCVFSEQSIDGSSTGMAYDQLEAIFVTKGAADEFAKSMDAAGVPTYRECFVVEEELRTNNPPGVITEGDDQSDAHSLDTSGHDVIE